MKWLLLVVGIVSVIVIEVIERTVLPWEGDGYMFALISSVAVGVASVAAINYVVRKVRIRNITNIVLGDAEKPLSEWLAIYNAQDDHVKPALACALIGAACIYGVDKGLISVPDGYDFMEYARKHDYVPQVRMMVEMHEDYPIAGVTDQTPAHELVALMIARFLNAANAARDVNHAKTK